MGGRASRCNGCDLAAHLVHQVYIPADQVGWHIRAFSPLSCIVAVHRE